jgi:hypothetical protein
VSKLFSKNRTVIIPGLCCCLLLLSACASTARTENTVEKRATARWDALLSDDLAGAYEYLSPGFRSSVSSVQYQRSVLLRKVAWTGAQYIESDCAETTCKVKISLDYALYGGVPGVKSFEGTEMIEESWVLVDGVWYLVPGK